MMTMQTWRETRISRSTISSFDKRVMIRMRNMTTRAKARHFQTPLLFLGLAV